MVVELQVKLHKTNAMSLCIAEVINLADPLHSAWLLSVNKKTKPVLSARLGDSSNSSQAAIGWQPDRTQAENHGLAVPSAG